MDDTREMEKMLDALQQQNWKLTPERKKILESITTMRPHFQAEDLLVKMRQQGLKVSKATIYRTLPIFLKCGFIREVSVGEKQTHYEYIYGKPAHHHLICSNCSKIIEFQEQALCQVLQEISSKHQFRISEEYIAEISGHCHECQEVLFPGESG